MATIEEVRALAAKHRAKLRQIYLEIVNPPKRSLKEHMALYRDDDYGEEELREIAIDYLNEKHRPERADPDRNMDYALRLVTQLCVAAVGEDRPEDREELETVGWRYLQLLDGEDAQG